MKKPVHIIGGGLAGTEAAWQLAMAGVPSILHEMRPNITTEAHVTGNLAELVCSNSFRSDDPHNNAVGLLHEEQRRLGSLILKSADLNKLPAGGALAVDRNEFSYYIESALLNEPLISVDRNEVAGLPPEDWDSVIIATGPLTSPSMSEAIKKLTGEDYLAFFDALSPIVYEESINKNIAWLQSRYDKGGTKDYINCPLEKDGYYKFINMLTNSETVDFKEWEKNTPYFEGCLPIEVMASRGPETLRYGPMKPVGLTDPKTGKSPFAVVQLRQDNKLGTLYNIVGFQTKMKHGEQKKILKQIPGLEGAEFARLGGLHRNTFLNSPSLLDSTLRLKNMPRIRFAGQITGVEGYVESAAIGLLAGRFAAAEYQGKQPCLPPLNTAFGSLLNHITSGADKEIFQPMNINFGLFPHLEKKVQKKERRPELSNRALSTLSAWIKECDLKTTQESRT